MSFAMDGIAALSGTKAAVVADSDRASSLQSSLGKLSSDSSDEELKQVCKDFASYFVEEVLKEVKESMLFEEEEEDSALTTMKDYHMDSAIELVADEIVDQVGGNYIQQLYEQMKRNYTVGLKDLPPA